MTPPSDDSSTAALGAHDAAEPYELRVAAVVRETHEAISIVFDVPPELAHVFGYVAGQFVTLKIPHDGKELSRCYSLASSPDCDREHKVTVKRVADGRVSNWLNDNLKAGDVLKVMPPGGLFTLKHNDRALVLFAGGSGITPIVSLIKTALVTSVRRLRLVYANQDERSIIFKSELDRLAAAHPERLSVVHHLDVASGFLDAAGVERLVVDFRDADFYVCGPGPFMDTVERALLGSGVDADRLHFERFVSPPDPYDPASRERALGDKKAAPAAGTSPATISVYLDGRSHELRYEPGQTILATVQRAGLEPPFSCTEGFCGCCMAKLRAGSVRMIKNDFLSERELRDGWVLTCQSIPETAECRVEYPD
jgi:3-ketosteroid 9alpha-monooxygenase subunit B